MRNLGSKEAQNVKVSSPGDGEKKFCPSASVRMLPKMQGHQNKVKLCNDSFFPSGEPKLSLLRLPLSMKKK